MKILGSFFAFVAFFVCGASSLSHAEIKVLSSVADDLGQAATANIRNAERLFCYHVNSKPQKYSGYTIDDMAVTGFCGVIDDNLRDMLTEQLLGTEEHIDFMHQESCTIQPKVMLRFVRGIDNTDVLISAPCHSLSIFYGGKVKTYNMKPATELLDTIVNAFKATQVKFVSPALLNQLLPIGVVQNESQREILNKENTPKRAWDNKASNQSKDKQGWNSLNF